MTAGRCTTVAAEHGLATGFGDTGSVGVAGMTLGGGGGGLEVVTELRFRLHEVASITQGMLFFEPDAGLPRRRLSGPDQGGPGRSEAVSGSRGPPGGSC